MRFDIRTVVSFVQEGWGFTEMTLFRSALAAGLGLAAVGLAHVQPAVAQYYGGPGYERPYDRRSGEGYERRNSGRDDDRRGWREDRRNSGYDDGRGGWREDRRGSGRDDIRGDGRNDRRPGFDGGRRPQDPMAGMSMDERKRAIKNEREVQKKIFKQQQFQRSLLGQ